MFCFGEWGGPLWPLPSYSILFVLWGRNSPEPQNVIVAARVGKPPCYCFAQRFPHIDQIGRDVAGMVDGVDKYQYILTSRVEFLRAGFPETALSVPEVHDDEAFTQVKETSKLVSATRGKSPGVEELKALQAHVATGLDKRLLSVLHSHGWAWGSFPLSEVDKVCADLDRLSAARFAEIKLEEFLALKRDAKVPAPAEGVKNLIPLASLKLFGLRLGAAETEHDVKSLEIEFKDAYALIGEIISSVKKAAVVLTSHIDKTKQREVSRAEAAQKSEQAKKDKWEKLAKMQADKQAKQKSKPSASTANEIKTPPASQLSAIMSHATGKECVIKSFETEQDFEEWRKKIDKEKENTSFEEMGPYIIKSVKSLIDAHSERYVKSSFAIFHVQFPNTQQAKTNLRGQQPFSGDRKDKIRELMVGLAPPTVDIPKTPPFACVERAVAGVSQFGIMPKFVSSAQIERHGLATLRYQVKGTREVVAISFEDMMLIVKHIDEHFPGECQLQENIDVLQALQGMFARIEKRHLDAFKEIPVKVYRGQIAENSFLYMPCGFLVFERVIGDGTVLGTRTSTLDRVAYTSFKSLVQKYATGAHDENMVKFWVQVLTALNSKDATDVLKEIEAGQ